MKIKKIKTPKKKLKLEYDTSVLKEFNITEKELLAIIEDSCEGDATAIRQLHNKDKI